MVIDHYAYYKITNEHLKTTAYNSVVHPQVEYASTVWEPHTANNTNKVEMVQ